jgi:hypothetical protein
MQCPICERQRSLNQFTAVQAKAIRTGHGCSSGGRDVCKGCWSKGPTRSDFIELDDYLGFWKLDVDTNKSQMIEFLVEFVLCVRSDGNRLKLWSHSDLGRPMARDNGLDGRDTQHMTLRQVDSGLSTRPTGCARAL